METDNFNSGKQFQSIQQNYSPFYQKNLVYTSQEPSENYAQGIPIQPHLALESVSAHNPTQQQGSIIRVMKPKGCSQIKLQKLIYFTFSVIIIVGAFYIIFSPKICPDGCENVRCLGENNIYYQCTCNDGLSCKSQIRDPQVMAIGISLIAIGFALSLCFRLYIWCLQPRNKVSNSRFG